MNNWKKLWTRDFGLQFFYAPMRGFGMSHILPHSIREVVVVPESKMQAIYVSETEFVALLAALREKYIEDFVALKRFIVAFTDAGATLVSESRKLAADAATQSNAELAVRLTHFLQRFGEYGAWLWATFLLNELMNEKVSTMLNAVTLPSNEKERLMEYALDPSEAAGVLLLAEDAQRKTITELTEDFKWLTTLDIHSEPAKENDIAERLISVKKIRIAAPESFDALDPLVQEAILFSKQTTYLKDARDDYRRKAMYEILPLYESIAKRSGLTRQDLSYMTEKEILTLLAGESTEELLAHARNRRVSGFVLVVENGDVVVKDTSGDIQKIYATIGSSVAHEVASSSEKEVRGVIGCKGKAHGRIVVVHGITEIGKVVDGSILCTVTTNPDYLPAMQKAKAFITDEGGVTCHAAIVARELKKPCIVGAKIATKVFKDGDLVEVDADKGIVRILERKG